MKPELTEERRAAKVFKDLLALEQPLERTAFLERACAGDAQLRAAVENLIAADRSGSLFPDTMADAETQLAKTSSSLACVDQAWPRSRSTTPAPDSIAGYTILREIHRGGQGVVYQAVQKSTNRKVAIKVLKEGPFAGPMHRARFEREVQVLGQLGHPNIIAIHDSGTAAGQHYFVMDYVAGQPLDVFMSSGERSIAQTIQMFRKICEAVSAAHMKGVIHRDLKPGNICVDAAGEPRVLDFGLAKFAGADTDGDAMTLTGQFLGSLPWASPEQAEGSSSKIDIRTDVYSLGVVLYQMLTGRFPYEVVGNMRDVLDRIMTAEPVPPRKLRRDIGDEVETIVLKCLAKDRDRRYQSAGELARDLGRYLAGEPIEAKRDSLRYLLRKHVRRHWLVVSFASILLAGMIGWIVTAGVLWQRATSNAILATQNFEKSERRRETLENVNYFLGHILAHPANGQNPELRVADLLDRSAAELDANAGQYSAQVLVPLRRMIGEAYITLGRYADAERQLADALESAQSADELTPRDIAMLNMRRGQAQLELGEVDDALASMNEAAGVFLSPEFDDQTFAALFKGNYAHVLGRSGDYDRAGSLFREALEVLERDLDPADLELASLRNRYAVLLRRTGRLAEAERMITAALSVRDAVLIPGHPEQITARLNLAEIQLEQHNFAGAEQNATRAADAAQHTLTDSHPHYATALILRGSALLALGRAADAEPLLRKSLEIRRGYLRPDHWRVASAQSALGQCLSQLGRDEEAEKLLTAAATALVDDRTAALIRRTEALDRLIGYYESTGRSADAGPWKEKRASLK